MDEQPLRSETAYLLRGGLSNSPGTLLLYADRLSHVASGAVAAGALGGAVGALVAVKVAKNRANQREAAGGKGITVLPLADLAEFHRAKQGLNKNVLEVVMRDGTTLKFGAKFDKWKPDLIAALAARGRQVVDGPDVVTVA